MSHSPRASVVIPSYNHERYIESAVRSVLRQDADLELIVIDDGSSDRSPKILKSIDDPRLHCIRQENQGAHAALNRGIGMCRGEIVFLLNSDDRFHRDRLPRLLERFEAEPGLHLLTSWLEIVDDHDQSLGVKEAWRNMPPWPLPRPGPSLADTGEPALVLLKANYVSTTSNVAFRLKWWQEHRLTFANLRYTHDWELLLAAACRGRMDVLAEPLASYRVHAKNTLAEGKDTQESAERGEAVMRFEILWTVARHAHRLMRRFGEQGWDVEDLNRRAWRSMPRFGQNPGRNDVLGWLLQLRGDGEEVPEAYDALLDLQSTLRRRCLELLMD